MTEEVAVCRICRCEGTPDAPLFHPCKCRGSIKYIHQDCLLSWLEHSHKDSCDICHASYHFKTVYDPNTPDILPAFIILRKVFSELRVLLYRLTQVALVAVLVIFQVPVFVSSIDRLLNWQLGCHVPYSSYTYGFIYGEEIPGKTAESLISDWDKLTTFFENTWSRGLTLILKYAFVLGSMLLIQGSVVSDEGFSKIIHKKIGPEPRMNRLIELLHRRQLRRLNNEIQNQNENENVGGNADDDQANLEELRRVVEDANRVMHEERPRNHDLLDDGHAIDGFDDLDANELNDIPNLPVLPDGAPPIDAIVPDEDAADNLNNRLFDMDKGITFIFQITIFMDVAVIGILMCLKTFPSLIGMATIDLVSSLVKSSFSSIYGLVHSTNVYTLAVRYIDGFLTSDTVHHLLQYCRDNKLIFNVTNFFMQNWFLPIKDVYTNTVQWTPSANTFERDSVVIVGFFIAGCAIMFIMRRMEHGCSQNNPLTGGYRSIYIVLLEIICILKVFALVMIEWLAFPLFCGYQIEFSLVPFFNDDLYTYKIDPPLLGDAVPLGVAPRWLLGTFFMYFFAAFVTMTRSYILRKGVLFFIRPSDDPDIRLLHDALMKPFSLKLYHIGLSAFVYSIYIMIEFTMVVWGVRLLSPIQILPSTPRFFQLERLDYVMLFFVASMAQDKIKAYWKWAFQYSCSKLRLSFFLLGNDVPSERGHVLYKNWNSRLTHFNALPDYSSPVLEHEAAHYFAEHPDTICCFVPDGNYVRAPDNDQVARTFVKELFVPVTKDDKLLAPIPTIDDDEDRYNPYGDEELLNIVTYTIVYRPPGFRNRIFCLLGMMWAFSMFLTFTLYADSVLIGVIMIRFPSLGGVFHLNDSWNSNPFKVDFVRIAAALLHLIFMSKLYDSFALQKDWIFQVLKGTATRNSHSCFSKIRLTLKVARRVVSIPAHNALRYIRRKADHLKVGLLIITYGFAEFIILALGITLPQKCLETYILSRPELLHSWIMSVYRVSVFAFIILSMNYLGGIVISLEPRFTVSFKIRYQIFYVSLVIGLIWILQFGYYLTSHPDDDFSWLFQNELSSEKGLSLSLLEYWIDLSVDRLTVTNFSCLGLWILFLMKEFSLQIKEFFGRVNGQLKEEYFSSGKVLTNASDDFNTDDVSVHSTNEVNE
ncbi:hypothetical protein FOA43_003354 [Brettanomyces nanus]|uniref:RING-type E3 ubiquitin transferase n=1 Tax=Eeniella nana TaxID=13502 RepID=A0A875S4U2_EENNA|nr:uncharacterized protein FOA43_003354 [Brettanomyces nanus]QPG75968.1 hypothetical protein FOA43_003354 [Brettanomyces nanus]